MAKKYNVEGCGEAIDAAIAGNGNQAKIDDALEKLADGEEERAAGDFKEAAKKYKEAVKKAIEAL